MYIADREDMLLAIEDWPGIKAMYEACKRTNVWHHFGIRCALDSYQLKDMREKFEDTRFGYRLQHSGDFAVLWCFVSAEEGFTQLCRSFDVLTQHELEAIDFAFYKMARELRVIKRGTF
jgi:hypothetical protein